MSKKDVELTDREKWFIAYILGSVSRAVLMYMGLNKEEAYEYGRLYHGISKKFPYESLPFERFLKNLDERHWIILDERKWNVTRKEEDIEKE